MVFPLMTNLEIDYHEDSTYSLEISAIQDITIITPENKTYTAPMSGYYPGTFGFENDLAGEFPTGFVRSGSDDVVEVIEGVAGHDKVLMVAEDASEEGWDGVTYFPDDPVPRLRRRQQFRRHEYHVR